MNDTDLGASPREEADILYGYVLMLSYGGSSKSAGLRPFLISNCYHPQMLCHKTDDSFSNATLRSYHLKHCRVAYEKEGDLLIVKSIEVAPDPAIAAP
jgi:hypothetical protein